MMRAILSFLIAFTLMWGYLGTRYALSHEDYSSSCCGGKDCHPVPCEEVESTGPMWKWHGYQIEKWRTMPSTDGGCHVCIHNENHSMICIYLGGGV
jgi:hypothetical protein